MALGTLYRYFPSKVHLLVSALGPRPRTTPERASPRPAQPVATPPPERVTALLAGTTRPDAGGPAR